MQENIQIKNSNNQNLSAVLHYPKEETNKLAILCPGFLDSKDYSHLVELAKVLSEKEGYTVVRFNPTGTWDSEGDISEYNNTQYLEDIKSVIDYVLIRKSADKIVLIGHSRGGMMSILYSLQDSRIASIIAIMPSSGRTMIGKRREDWERDGYSLNYRDIPGKDEKKEYKVPYSHILDRDKYNIFEDVKKVTIPKLFIAGGLDKIVLAQDVKEIFEQANEPKKFTIIDGVGHDYRHNLDDINKVNSEVINFLKNI